MARRRIPNIFEQMGSILRPYYAGKIDVNPLGYRYGIRGFTNQNGVHFKATTDDRGDSIELYRRRTVWCPLQLEGVPLVRGNSCVKLTVCKMCEHRLPKGCCAIKRRAAQGGKKL